MAARIGANAIVPRSRQGSLVPAQPRATEATQGTPRIPRQVDGSVVCAWSGQTIGRRHKQASFTRRTLLVARRVVEFARPSVVDQVRASTLLPVLARFKSVVNHRVAAHAWRFGDHRRRAATQQPSVSYYETAGTWVVLLPEQPVPRRRRVWKLSHALRQEKIAHLKGGLFSPVEVGMRTWIKQPKAAMGSIFERLARKYDEPEKTIPKIIVFSERSYNPALSAIRFATLTHGRPSSVAPLITIAFPVLTIQNF